MNMTDSKSSNHPSRKPKSSPADGIFPGDGEIFGAHWHIFFPTILIAILYILGLVWLMAMSRGDGALARLFTLVIAVGVPLLIAHALLRYNTCQIQIADDHVRYHQGWPKRLPADLPYVLIEKSKIRRGLSGRIFGGGTLQLILTTGQQISVPDLKDPEAAKRALDLRMSQINHDLESDKADA